MTKFLRIAIAAVMILTSTLVLPSFASQTEAANNAPTTEQVQQTYSRTLSCSQPVGMANFTAYANVTVQSVPINGGRYTTIQSVNNTYHSFTGITAAINIRNVNISTSVWDGRTLYISGSFDAAFYVPITPWGGFEILTQRVTFNCIVHV